MPISAPDIEQTLEIVDTLGLQDETFRCQRLARDGGVQVAVVLHMLRNLVRLGILVVVCRFDVVPWQLAQTLESEPGAEHGEVVQRFGLFLEGWKVVVHHVHENEPRFVMLRAFVCQVIAALLSKRFLGDVLGLLEALAMQRDILHQLGIRAKLADEILGKEFDALAGEQTEWLALDHVMENLRCAFPVAPAEVNAPCEFRIDDTEFPALHEEGGGGAEADGVDAVGIAVEIQFEDAVRVIDIEVRTDTRSSFVFRAVYADFLAFVGTGLELEMIDRMGACQCTAIPAAIGEMLAEQLFPHPARNFRTLGILAIAMVLGGQEVVIIHDLHEVCSTLAAHLALAVIIDHYLAMQLEADALDFCRIGGAV